MLMLIIGALPRFLAVWRFEGRCPGESPRTEHAARDARDRAARGQPLALRHEIVSHPGNDVTLSRGEGSKSHAGHFFGCFLVRRGARGRAGNLAELTLGRARAQAAHAHAALTH